MNLSTSTIADSQVITVLEARIDASVAIQFKDTMRKLTEDAPNRVILDLAQVEFIDSSGLGAIVASMKQLGADRKLDLSGLSVNVDKVFRLTRMDTIFGIFPDLETATKASA